jgi:anti-sigma B factor antagonist
MDLQVTTRGSGNPTVVALAGIADLASLPVLHDHLRQAVTRHPGTIVTLDFDGLLVIDDAALGIVLGAAAHAREHGGDLEVVCTNERLRARLSTTRFDLAVAVRDAIV